MATRAGVWAEDSRRRGRSGAAVPSAAATCPYGEAARSIAKRWLAAGCIGTRRAAPCAAASIFLGRSKEALVELDTAERLSPRDFQAGLNNIARAIACFIDGRYRDGVDFARTATRQNPDAVGAHHLVVVNSALAGDVEAAREALQTLKSFEPDISLQTLDMAVYARDEDRRRYFEAFRLSGLE